MARKRARRLGVALAAACMLAGVVPPSGAAPLEPSGRVLQQFAVVFVARSQFNQGQAVDLARKFDLMIAYATQLRGQVPAMRAANPNVRVFVYTNGIATQPSTSYPDDYYSHDAGGNRITIRQFGTYLMNPSSQGWRKVLEDQCTSLLQRSGYDGCYIDTLGVQARVL